MLTTKAFLGLASLTRLAVGMSIPQDLSEGLNVAQRFTAVAASIVFMGTAAVAADLPTVQTVPAPAAPWEFDLAFGAGIATDYNFRGISQSDRGFSPRGYVEAKYGWLYAGAYAYGVDLPTRPGAEIDLYGGIRPVLGPVTLDFGGTYYFYPNESVLRDPATQVALTLGNTDFWEAYAKATWQATEQVSVGAAVYYAPSWLNSGATGTYGSLTAAITLPYDLSLSGELGRYWLGTVDPSLGSINLPDYTYWNVGLTYTYQNTFKFDVRYHGTDLNQSECFTLTTDPGGLATGRSRWCGDAVIATVSFDTSLSALRATAAPR